MKKHGKENRRVWRKLHLAFDVDSQQIIAVEMSLSNVTDGEVLSQLLQQTQRKIKAISWDGAYDTRRCYEAIAKKKASPLIPPSYWGCLLEAWTSS